MRSLYILAFGAAALVAASCGARTPFDGTETAGAGGTTGQPTTSAGTGPTTSSTGSGNTTTTTGPDTTTSSSATSGSQTSTGSTGPGTTGTSGTTAGTTSSSTVATTTTGPIPASGAGSGGAATTATGTIGVGSTVSTTTGGTGGRAGSGGSGGTTGRDGGPGPDASTVNPLLGVLPGVRPTPQCTQCVNTRCNGTSSCSSDPACVGGVACYFTACWLLPTQNQQIACALKCFNGNIAQAMAASNAVTCVYTACAPFCVGGRGGPGGVPGSGPGGG